MATETLRPNAAGDEESIPNQYGCNLGSHQDCVDEVEADEAGTIVKAEDSATYHRDLYKLPASSGSGEINFIKIYFRVRAGNAAGRVKPSLKSNGTVTDGDEIDPPTDYTTYFQQWLTNPADDEAWEWADIDALQIGISIHTKYTYCTQVYVEVDYTPPGAGRSYGFIIG